MQRISIIVKPNSKENNIIFDKEKNAYRVSIRAKAKGNKANIELIKFFSKTFKKKASIHSGLKSRKKVIQLDD